MIFYFTFSLARVIFYLTSLSPGNLGITFEPTFGQLLPLNLALLPFLFMAEGYSGRHRDQDFLPLVKITDLLQDLSEHDNQDSGQKRSNSQLSPRSVGPTLESQTAAMEGKEANDDRKNELDALDSRPEMARFNT